MLALLKRTFIEKVGSSEVALRDRILSMDDGFEFLLKNRSSLAAFEGISKIYNLCTGRDFSATYETDPDFVKKLAEVRLHVIMLLDADSFASALAIFYQPNQKQQHFPQSPILPFHLTVESNPIVSTFLMMRFMLKPLRARQTPQFPMNQKHTLHFCAAMVSPESSPA